MTVVGCVLVLMVVGCVLVGGAWRPGRHQLRVHSVLRATESQQQRLHAGHVRQGTSRRWSWRRVREGLQEILCYSVKLCETVPSQLKQDEQTTWIGASLYHQTWKYGANFADFWWIIGSYQFVSCVLMADSVTQVELWSACEWGICLCVVCDALLLTDSASHQHQTHSRKHGRLKIVHKLWWRLN